MRARFVLLALVLAFPLAPVAGATPEPQCANVVLSPPDGAPAGVGYSTDGKIVVVLTEYVAGGSDVGFSIDPAECVPSPVFMPVESAMQATNQVGRDPIQGVMPLLP